MDKIRERNRRITVVTSVLWLALAVCSVSHAGGEDENLKIGFSSDHIFESTIKGEYVDVLTGNVTLTLPIGPRFQLSEHFGYQLELFYNSKTWQQGCVPNECRPYPSNGDDFGHGFLMHFGRIYHHPDDLPWIYRYQEPNGSEHFVCDQDNQADRCKGKSPNGASSDVTYANWGEGFTTDNEPMRYFINFTGTDKATITKTDGTSITFSHRANWNWKTATWQDNAEGAGLYASWIAPSEPTSTSCSPFHTIDVLHSCPAKESVLIEYLPNSPRISKITDSAGRAIKFAWGSSQLTISMPGFIDPSVSGPPDPTADPPAWPEATYTLHFDHRSIWDISTRNTVPDWTADITYNVGINDMPGGNMPAPGNPDVPPAEWPHRRFLTAITLPELQASENYEFFYDEGMHFDDGKNGRLTSWKTPTGARTHYRYTYYPSSQRQPAHINMYAKKLVADGQEYVWTYNRFGSGTIESWEDLVAATVGIGAFRMTNPARVSVLDPFNNLTVYRFNTTYFASTRAPNEWDDGKLIQIETFAGPQANDSFLVRRQDFEYVWDGITFEVKNGSSEYDNEVEHIGTRQAASDTTTFGPASAPTTVRQESGAWYHDENPFESQLFYKARSNRTYVDGVLFRENYTNWKLQSLSSVSGHGHFPIYDYSLTRDGAGQILRRDDVAFDGWTPRIECSVSRSVPTEPPTGHTSSLSCGQLLATAEPGDLVTRNTFTEDLNDQTFEAVNETRRTERYVEGGSSPAYDVVEEIARGVLKQRDFSQNISWLPVNRSVDPVTGKVASSTTPDGVVTSYDWDLLGRLKSIHADAPEWSTEVYFDDIHTTRVVQAATPNQPGTDYVEGTYLYDELGRVREERRRNDQGTQEYRRFERDIDGMVLRQSDWAPDGTTPENLSWTEYEYFSFEDPQNPGNFFRDPLGRVSKVTLPDGSTTETTYDGNDRTVTVRDVAGSNGAFDASTTFRSDSLGRLVSVDSAGLGADAFYEYDEFDQLRQVKLVDPLDNSIEQYRTFEYDALGRMITEHHPESGLTEYRDYDARGNALEQVDANGDVYRSSFDEAGRLLSRTVDEGNGANRLVENIYDESGFAGHLTTQVSYQVTHGVEEEVVTTSFAYGGSGGADCGISGFSDASYSGLNGRLSTTTTRFPGWANDITTESCYHPLGAPNVLKYPQQAGSTRTRGVVATSLSNGIVSQIHDPNRNHTFANALQYDARGALTSFTRQNGIVNETQRDILGRPSQILATLPQPSGPDTVLFDSGAYAYDGAGNIKQIGSDTYTYDPLMRLEQADVHTTNSLFRMTYTYDSFGNMLTRLKDVAGADFTTTLGISGTSNRLATIHLPGATAADDVGYDPNGNMLDTERQQFVFGPDNRMHEAWTRVVPGQWDTTMVLDGRYWYDASGYRVRTVIGQQETFYVRDAGGQLLSEFSRPIQDSDAPDWSRDYIYGLGQTLSMVANSEPAIPDNFRTTGAHTSAIDLAWDLVDDDDVTGYVVVRETNAQSSGGGGFGGGGSFGGVHQVDATTSSVIDDISDLIVDNTTWFRYTVRSFDGAGLMSRRSTPLRVRFDGPPQTPILTADPGDSVIHLSWTAATNDDLAGYLIERKRIAPALNFYQPAHEGLVQATSFADLTVSNGFKYRYRVSAIDHSGQMSPSAEMTEWLKPLDEVPPSKPTGVVALPGLTATEMTLAWNPATENDIRGYELLDASVSPAATLCPDDVDGYPICVTAGSFQYALSGLTAGSDYTFMVRAYDTSGNPSEDAIVTAPTRRADHIPTLDAALYEVDCVGPACAAPIHPDDCVGDINNNLRVALRWNLEDDTVDSYRIYRRPGAGDAWNFLTSVLPTDVIPDGETGTLREFHDTSVLASSYDYYVVSMIDGEESAACSGTTPCWVTASEQIDPATTHVRSIEIDDGTEEGQKPSASITVRWQEIASAEIVGYNVYRRCTWSICNAETTVDVVSTSHYGCNSSWVRLNSSPVQGNQIVDIPRDRLSGCNEYVVRPVFSDGTEGTIHKIQSAVFNPGLGAPQGRQCQSTGETQHDWPKSMWVPESYEIQRILDASATPGAGAPEHAPAAPQYVTQDSFTRILEVDPDDEPWDLLGGCPVDNRLITWRPNSESDLRGYHVEMAGSLGGPWQRLTEYPVAWWESSYIAHLESGRGEFCIPASKEVHFRVIAVDESGLESPPTEVAYSLKSGPYSICGAWDATVLNQAQLDAYCNGSPSVFLDATPCDWASVDGTTVTEADVLAACTDPLDLAASGLPAGPTLDAPQHVTAETWTFVDDCHTRVGWDEIPGATHYEVYRMVQWKSRSFFLAATVLPVDCTSGRCHWIEGDQDEVCPQSSNEPCYGCGHWAEVEGWYSCGWQHEQAFYVRAYSADGHSGRSETVFWECDDHAPVGSSSLLWVEPGTSDVLWAAAGLDPVEAEVCSVDLGPVAAGSASAEFAEAPLLVLGQVGGDPPFEVFDLHVDHLGSTRLVTDQAGGMVSRHKFLPFGEEAEPVRAATRKMFTGHERDEGSGLDYMLARSYSGSIGRFLNADPGGDYDFAMPQSWNHFTYLRNNPVNGVDPTGMYGRPSDGGGFTDEQWREFDDSQKEAAADAEAAAEKLDAAAEEIESLQDGEEPSDSTKKVMKDFGKKLGKHDDLVGAMRSAASTFRKSAEALGDDGTLGYYATALNDPKSTLAGRATVNGKLLQVNVAHSAFKSPAQRRRVAGHESLHNAGLRDQTIGTRKVYKESGRMRRLARKHPQRAIRNPDNLLWFAQ